ncbi:hypothetical protein [Streptomyces sp. H27-C3]|uniref:hypothetical protein n=1 Tax=Streptomyces sp. H27-C3 TaxID=3046305 RepID=UPI0024BB6440|nr:hypothetical protein [Streptomyces sp. H27-C3]MDJ0460609.1 hypothetical protein [Streptomyces sp. H27-C3]
MITFAFVLLAMLTVLAIVTTWPRLERPWMLRAVRVTALALTAAAYIVTAVALLT